MGRLGRDQNGRTLHAERTSWLDENRVRQPEERELFHAFFDIVDSERAAAEAERIEELRAD